MSYVADLLINPLIPGQFHEMNMCTLLNELQLLIEIQQLIIYHYLSQI